MIALYLGAVLVALLAEGVDRNLLDGQPCIAHLEVALLAEGVDRNMVVTLRAAVLPWSPSSRRAWIEIDSRVCSGHGVYLSPSSRRAWIEIFWPSVY